MVAEDGVATAGICHARGLNGDLPAQWLIYIVVEDVERSAAACVELGGQVLVAPRDMAGGRYCVIRDPAGAVCALYTPPR
jgi:predicted enzyme related to lactoylglutathione lyase